MRSSAELSLRRRSDRDRADSGHLRRYHVHDHARGQGRQATGHVEAHPVDRNHTLDDVRTWSELDRDSMLSALCLAYGPSPADRQLESGLQIRVEPADGRFDVCRGYPEICGHDAVELLGPTCQGLHSVDGDVVTNRTNGLQSRRDVKLRPRDGGAVVHGLTGREPATQVDHRKHAEILRRRPPTAPNYLSGRGQGADMAP